MTDQFITSCWDSLPWAVRMGIYAHTVGPFIVLGLFLIIIGGCCLYLKITTGKWTL